MLHFAARIGNEAVVRLLVDRETDVMAKNNDGRTALEQYTLQRYHNLA
jgi:ankyrin repeat protein